MGLWERVTAHHYVQLYGTRKEWLAPQPVAEWTFRRWRKPDRFKRRERTMAIIAEEFEFIVGVDTHARTHTFTAVHATTGAVVDTTTFPATFAETDRAIT